MSKEIIYADDVIMGKRTQEKKKRLGTLYKEKKLLKEAKKEIAKRTKGIDAEVEGGTVLKSLSKKGNSSGRNLMDLQKEMSTKGGDIKKEKLNAYREVNEGIKAADRLISKVEKKITRLRKELGIKEREGKKWVNREFQPTEKASEAFKHESRRMPQHKLMDKKQLEDYLKKLKSEKNKLEEKKKRMGNVEPKKKPRVLKKKSKKKKVEESKPWWKFWK